MNFKHLYININLIIGCLLFANFAIAAPKNAGLGPFEMRSQFPLTQQFLFMYPENTATLEKDESRFSYNIAVANTFSNTQGLSNQITKTEAENGITLSDFLDTDGNVVNGFSVYIDVESKRQTLHYQNGWSDSFEFSFEIPFVSFTGGQMDSVIEDVHTAVGINNYGNGGAYRSLSAKNKFDYYVVQDNQTLYASSEAFYNIQAEPSIGLKWNLSEGGKALPAITLKLSYKFALSDRTGSQQIVRSGSSDWGYYLIFSKGFEDWVIYFGDGSSNFGESHSLASDIKHRFMAMEKRISEESSLIFQTVSQSSIFPKTNTSPRTTGIESQEQRNYNLSTPTSVATLGYKSIFGPFSWETGFIQDYSNFGNETDFVLFFEMGVQW